MTDRSPVYLTMMDRTLTNGFFRLTVKQHTKTKRPLKQLADGFLGLYELSCGSSDVAEHSLR